VTGGNDGTALQAASCAGHHDIVILLLKYGADVNVKVRNNSTALQAAAGEGRQDVVIL
jgi:ankyrin repeat protein